MDEQQKQIAREAYDNDDGTFDYPYDGVYAAVEAVLEQQSDEQEQQALTVRQRNEITARLSNRKYTLAAIKDFWDVYDSVLAQRTPEPAPTPERTYSAQETWPFGQPNPAPAWFLPEDDVRLGRQIIVTVNSNYSSTKPVPAPQSVPGPDWSQLPPQSTDEDVVERMHRAFEDGIENYRKTRTGDFSPHDCVIAGMTATLAEARRGYHSDAEIEKAIRDEALEGWASDIVNYAGFSEAVLARLSAKEKPVL